MKSESCGIRVEKTDEKVLHKKDFYKKSDLFVIVLSFLRVRQNILSNRQSPTELKN